MSAFKPAVLTTPRGGEATGLIIMLHGDAPGEATPDALYDPWFEAAADSGWATPSLSNPGVGGSTGDWLAQTLDDRASESAWCWIRRKTRLMFPAPASCSGALVKRAGFFLRSLQRGASYDEYLAETSEQNPMSRERWRFVTLNCRSDAASDLRATARGDIS